MDFDMVRVREDVSLEVVLRYLRRLHELPDHTDQIFVVDRQDKLQGTLYLSTLLVSEPETEVSEVMSTDRSEEHTSELQSLMRSSYAVFCLKKKKYTKQRKY